MTMRMRGIADYPPSTLSGGEHHVEQVQYALDLYAKDWSGAWDISASVDVAAEDENHIGGLTIQFTARCLQDNLSTEEFRELFMRLASHFEGFLYGKLSIRTQNRHRKISLPE